MDLESISQQRKWCTYILKKWNKFLNVRTKVNELGNIQKYQVYFFWISCYKKLQFYNLIFILEDEQTETESVCSSSRMKIRLYNLLWKLVTYHYSVYWTRITSILFLCVHKGVSERD